MYVARIPSANGRLSKPRGLGLLLAVWFLLFLGASSGAEEQAPADEANDTEEQNGELEFAEEMPSPSTAAEPPEPGEPSRLTVRLVLDADLAREHLESVTPEQRKRPERFTQNGPDGADGGLFADMENYDYRYWYERGPFDVEPNERGLSVRTRVNANVDARTRLLPQTPLLERSLRDRRVDLGADLSVAVDDEWNLQVEVEAFHLEIIDPITIELQLPGADPIVLADVTDYVEQELREMLEARMPRLLKVVERSVDVPSVVRHAWAEMIAKPHPIEVPNDDGPAELVLRPEEAAVGELHGRDGKLLIDIEVVCRPLFSLAELEYEMPEVPTNGELQTNGEPFHVLTEVLVPLARLSEQLEAAIEADQEDEQRAERWRFEEGTIWVQIRHAKVTADGDELVALLLVDSNLHPRRPARIGLVMRPVLAEEGTRLRFEDLRLTDSTAQWWRTRYRGLPAEPLLESVREALVIDLTQELELLRSRVRDFLNQPHPLDASHILRGEARLDEPVRLRDIRVREATEAAQSFEEEDPRRHLVGEADGASAVLYVDLVGRMLAHIAAREE